MVIKFREPPIGRRLKISVCIATYNQSPFIGDCIMSVLMQICPADLEILVGDDCSTDDTADVVQSISDLYPGRVTLLRRTANLGPSQNYQDMISRATGDYIAHLDGDDFWIPGKLAAQLEFFKSNPDCSAVYTNAYVVNSVGEMTATFTGSHPPRFDTRYLLQGHNFLNHSSMMYRADLRGTLVGIVGEFIDYRMHLRLSRFGDLGFVNRHLVVYRTGVAASMSASASDKVRALYWESLCDSAIADLPAKSLVAGKSSLIAVIICDSLRRGRASYALSWSKRAWRESTGQGWSVLLGTTRVVTSLLGRSIRHRLGELIAGRTIRVAHEQ